MLTFLREPHIVRASKSIFKALYATLGIFITFFVLFHIGSALYVSSLSTRQSQAFQNGVTQDEAYLKVQGDAVTQNKLLVTQLLAGNRSSIFEIMQQERLARNIGLIGIANSEGVIVSRTLSAGKYGDNVFLTMPTGRIVAQGESVQSIELTGFGNQLFMTTARPIKVNTVMVGALFANYLLDDGYASHFKSAYLSPGTEVVFYTKDYGVYGDSFADPAIRTLVDSYFSAGSDWVRNGSTDKTITFDNGTSYLLENIVFPGLEKSPGGAILFIPRRDISVYANLITALLTLFTFVFSALYRHVSMRGEERSWRYYVTLSCVAVVVFLLSLIVLQAQNVGRLRLARVPYPLYNSTIRLQPESGIYDVGFEQRFSVIVDTGDESINAVQIGLDFDPEAIDVRALDTASSTCSYVIENTIEQKTGTAFLNCVLVHLAQGQHSLNIVDVVVAPRHVGSFKLAFNDATKILANDGLATDVLRTTQSGSYRVENFNASWLEKALATSSVQSLVVFSPTHPNESRWYNLQKARFVWRGKPDTIYRYAFDTSPQTIPTNEHTVQGTTVDISVPGDGVYYFHVQLASGGPVDHYRIQSDMTPPTILAMNLSQDKVFVGDVVRFSFNAMDQVSGIQRNYYVDLGGHLFLPVGSELFVPFQEAGDQKVTLRVYDGAGNYTERTEVIHVDNK